MTTTRGYRAKTAKINLHATVKYFRADEGCVSHLNYLRDNLLLTGWCILQWPKVPWTVKIYIKIMLQYSPKPLREYPWACASAFLKGDPMAWNLAWLSYAPEHGSKFNAQFTSAVSQTCNSLLANGNIDLLDRAPVKAKVCGLMHLPPPAAFKRLTESPAFTALPLYKLFGSDWERLMALRAREYREPFNPTLDAPLPTLAQAGAVLSAF